MTNWALNRFRFEGDAKDVAAFVEMAFGPEKRSGREVWNFEAFVPTPEVFMSAPRDRYGDFVNRADEKAARAWRYAHWGCQGLIEEYAIVRREATCIEICFATPYTAPSGIWRAIAARFQRAKIWAAAYERGHGYGYRFAAENGAVQERQCEVDDQLLREVEGENYPRKYVSMRDLMDQNHGKARTFATVNDLVEYISTKAPSA